VIFIFVKEYYIKHKERLTTLYKENYLRRKGGRETRPYKYKHNTEQKTKPEKQTHVRIVDEIVVSFR